MTHPPPAYKMLTALLICYFTLLSSLILINFQVQTPNYRPLVLPEFAAQCRDPERSSAATAAWNGSVSETMQAGCNPHLYFVQHSCNFPAAFSHISHPKLLSLWGLEKFHALLNTGWNTVYWRRHHGRLLAQGTVLHYLYHPLIMHACTREVGFHVCVNVPICLRAVCGSKHVWLSMCVFISGQMLISPVTAFGLSEE